MAASTLAMLDRPEGRKALDDFLRHAPPPGEVGVADLGVEEDASWSVARSESARATSVAMTLWMSGMCLSPMPWMLCSPNPLLSIVGHSSASTATVREPVFSLR